MIQEGISNTHKTEEKGFAWLFFKFILEKKVKKEKNNSGMFF